MRAGFLARYLVYCQGHGYRREAPTSYRRARRRHVRDAGGLHQRRSAAHDRRAVKLTSRLAFCRLTGFTPRQFNAGLEQEKFQVIFAVGERDGVDVQGGHARGHGG